MSRTIPEPGTAVMDPEAPLCFIGCPRRPGTVCHAWVNPESDPRWELHGPRERPTLTPSYNCVRGCGWHGFVVDGKLVDAPPGLTSLHVCAACGEPEIHVIRLGVVDGQLLAAAERIRVREP